MEEKNQWWGYKHVENTIHVKRYFDRQDIVEALSSDFVKSVAGPFYAVDREEAMRILKERI